MHDGAQERLDKEHPRPPATWNSTLAIHTLPNELIIDIFGLYCRAHTFAGCARDEVFHVLWCRLMSVCRRWREVVCTTPHFWRCIDVRRRHEWLDLCLLRSIGCTVDVTFWNAALLPDQIGRIRPHSPRIRSLYFKSAKMPSELTAISHQISAPMPELENVVLPRIRSDGTESPSEIAIHVDISSERFPRLRTLGLSWTTIPEDITIYPQLRTLTLFACTPRVPTHKLLEILSYCSRLEELTLGEVFVFEGFPSHEPISCRARPPVSLSRVKRFTLEGDVTFAYAHFLTHIRLPPSACVALKNIVGHLQHTLLHAFPSLASSRLSALPMFANMKFGTVTVNDYRYQVDAYADKSQYVHLSRDTPALEFFSWGRRLPEAMHDFAVLFSSSELTALEVNGGHDLFATNAWAELFSTFPTLETLTIRGLGLTGTMWEALHAASMDGSGDVACHLLKSIVVDGELGNPDLFFESLMCCLGHRAERGSPLERLHLTVIVRNINESRNDYGGMKAKYGPRLKELVGTLLYEECE